MNKTQIKDTDIGPVITDETGTYRICRRRMWAEEVADENVPDVVCDNIGYKIFRLDITAAQKSNPDAVAMPDLTKATLLQARKQVFLYDGHVFNYEGQGQVVTKAIVEPHLRAHNAMDTAEKPEHRESIFGGLGLNTEDSSNEGPSQVLSPDALKFPKDSAAFTRETLETSEAAETSRGLAESSLLDIIISSSTRTWASPDDIIWARELVSGILTSMTDISERRIPDIAAALSDGVIYGFLNRKFGSGIPISDKQFAYLSNAVQAQEIFDTNEFARFKPKPISDDS